MTGCLTQCHKPFEIVELLDEQCLAQDHVRNPILHDLGRRWHQAAGQGAFPDRDAFRPETLAGALSRLMILQIEGQDEPTFRYRLIGTGLCDFFGYDLTGRTTDDIPCPAFARSVWLQNRQTSKAGGPTFHGMRVTDGEVVHHYEKIILPVTATDGGNQLLACSFPIDV